MGVCLLFQGVRYDTLLGGEFWITLRCCGGLPPVPGGEVGHIAWWRVLDYSKVLWRFASCSRG